MRGAILPLEHTPSLRAQGQLRLYLFLQNKYLNFTTKFLYSYTIDDLFHFSQFKKLYFWLRRGVASYVIVHRAKGDSN